jgi:hypothetical protein
VSTAYNLATDYCLSMNNFIPERLSTLCDPIFEQAVDEAIEQHRLNGNAVSEAMP